MHKEVLTAMKKKILKATLQKLIKKHIKTKSSTFFNYYLVSFLESLIHLR